MISLKNTLSIAFSMVSIMAFSQKSIKQDVTSENGKIKIHIEKEENGKKEIFDKSFKVDGLTNNQKQELIDRVTDSLSNGGGRNMKMRVKINRGDDDNLVINNDIEGNDKITNKSKKRIVIKKNGKTIQKNDEGTDIENLKDLSKNENFDINIDMNGMDLDMHDLENKMGDLGKTLQFKFDDMGPMMKKFGEDFGSKFNGGNFNFDMAGSSKTVKDLNAFPNKPNNNKLNVKFEAPEKGDVTIRVTDLTGKEIGIEKLQDFSGEYIGQIDLKGNSKGTVFVTVVQGDDGSTRRVVLN